VPGYYQDTLKAELRAENRKVGFAFLDVNTDASYKIVLDFLLDVMGPERMFIFLDEYFMDPPAPRLYRKFTAEAKRRHGLESLLYEERWSLPRTFLSDAWRLS
jgi:hypothetical protein